MLKRYSYTVSPLFFFVLYFMQSNCMDDRMILSPTMGGVKRKAGAFLVPEGNGKAYEGFLQRPDVRIICVEKFEERFDVCFTTAITNQLGILGKAPQLLPLSLGSDLITECKVLDKYYEQSDQPQKDGLAVFTDDKHFMLHFGFITSPFDNNIYDTTVMSKFGTKKEVVEHKLFDGTTPDGNNVFFYTLKELFKADKQEMLKSLNDDLKKSQKVKDGILYARTLLLQLANGKDVIHKNEQGFNVQESLSHKICYLFKTCMGLKIDTVNQAGKTPLMLAAQRGDDAVVGQLLSMNAAINKQDKNGNTALHFASKCNNALVACVLLQYGAKTDIKNNNNECPVITAQVNSHLNNWNIILMSVASGKTVDVNGLKRSNATEQLQFLLDSRGPNLHLNMKLVNGLTLLGIAVIYQNIEAIKILLSRGVDQHIKDDKGFSAYDYAQQSGNEELKQLFQK